MNKKEIPPCHLCNGKCCRYFAFEIDRPATKKDFDNLRWYLLHKNTLIFVDEKKWFIQLNNECEFLSNDNTCSIYDKRPEICKEYGLDENHKVHCDKLCENEKHELEFHSIKQLDPYIKKRFPVKKKTNKQRRTK
ncbi:MAG: hypothetical protein ACD_79C00585G0009 [uncultured bacterium]|nr:MAG: hypothetical protein ACD_79C00585G0009 [uncultured bacterium]